MYQQPQQPHAQLPQMTQHQQGGIVEDDADGEQDYGANG